MNLNVNKLAHAVEERWSCMRAKSETLPKVALDKCVSTRWNSASDLLYTAPPVRPVRARAPNEAPSRWSSSEALEPATTCPLRPSRRFSILRRGSVSSVCSDSASESTIGSISSFTNASIVSDSSTEISDQIYTAHLLPRTACCDSVVSSVSGSSVYSQQSKQESQKTYANDRSPGRRKRPSISKKSAKRVPGNRAGMLQRTNSRQSLLQRTGNVGMLERSKSRQNLLQRTGSRRDLLLRSKSREKLLKRTESHRDLLQSNESRRNLLVKSRSLKDLMQQGAKSRAVVRSCSHDGVPNVARRRSQLDRSKSTSRLQDMVLDLDSIASLEAKESPKDITNRHASDQKCASTDVSVSSTTSSLGCVVASMAA